MFRWSSLRKFSEFTCYFLACICKRLKCTYWYAVRSFQMQYAYSLFLTIHFFKSWPVRDLFLYILSVVFFQGLVFFHQLANEKSCMPNFTEFKYAQEVTFLQIYIINDNNGFWNRQSAIYCNEEFIRSGHALFVIAARAFRKGTSHL